MLLDPLHGRLDGGLGIGQRRWLMWKIRASLKGVLASVAVALVGGSLQAVPATPGLYAVFNVSWGNPVQTGSFTIKLDYERAPLTVANFVTLAEGTRSWLRAADGKIRATPYYNGITFHRVISGFMIQGGSPNGLGTDGPGYIFPDEFHPQLRHSKAGILSMANSGIATNGSQFFITLGATSWLDDTHSVFGEVVENLTVVQAIGQTPVGTNDRPVAPAVITSVEIVRQGTAAQAWDPLAQPLPQIKGWQGILGQTVDPSPAFTLNWPRPGTGSTLVYGSENLAQWQGLGDFLDRDFASPDPLPIDPSFAAKPRQFFNLVRVELPGGIPTPTVLRGHRLVMTTVPGPPQAGFTMTVNFTGDSTGTFTCVPVGGSAISGNVTHYAIYQVGVYVLLVDIYYANNLPVQYAASFVDMGFYNSSSGFGKKVTQNGANSYNFTFTWQPIP